MRPGRSLKNLPRRQYWIIRSGLVFHMIIEICVNSRAVRLLGNRLIVAALIRYSKEAPEVISRRWKHAVDMMKSKRSQEADELLR